MKNKPKGMIKAMDDLKVEDGIRDLIGKMWKHSYQTLYSCEGHYSRDAWKYVCYKQGSGDGWFEENAGKLGFESFKRGKVYDDQADKGVEVISYCGRPEIPKKTEICKKGKILFPVGSFVPKFINEGGDGIVFRISPEHAAKMAYPHDDFQPIAEEYETSKIFYEKGISVPKPEGIFDVIIDNKSEKSFVMQYIEGATLAELFFYKKLKKILGSRIDDSMNLEKLGFSLDDLVDLKKQYNNEINKVRNLKFKPLFGWNFKDCLCSAKDKKAYLIDFVDWRGPEGR
jgi:hypothetical protein